MELTEHRPSGCSVLVLLKETIAARIEDAAEAVRKTAETGDIPPEFSDYGRHASTLLEDSAAYLRNFDIERAKTDLQQRIRSNPGTTILIGLSAGLFVGMLFRRRR